MRVVWSQPRVWAKSRKRMLVFARATACACDTAELLGATGVKPSAGVAKRTEAAVRVAVAAAQAARTDEIRDMESQHLLQE